MQQTLGFSPLNTGLAFLPMMAVLMPAGAIGQTRLMPRFGTRPLVTLGMVLSAAAMLMFTGVSVDSSYATDVLPGLMVMGLGLGLVFAPAMSTATLGVDRRDAGVASALVNTGQQIGGSIGTALLSTLAASAASATRRPGAGAASRTGRRPRLHHGVRLGRRDLRDRRPASWPLLVRRARGRAAPPPSWCSPTKETTGP